MTTEKKPQAYRPPDAILGRSLKTEKRINEALRIAFSGDVGEMALDYLKSITINYIGGPEISNDSLRHLEGQRYLVSIIERRIKDDLDGLPKLNQETKTK